MQTKKTQSPESFWARVDKKGPDDCWEWQRCIGGTGYGIVRWGRRAYSTHRVAAFLVGKLVSLKFTGDWRSKSCVLHTCDNRRCCNPAHLEIGTQSKNMFDAYARKRKAELVGGDNPFAKLSDEQAREIRQQYERGSYSERSLASAYGVSRATIRGVLSGSKYKNA